MTVSFSPAFRLSSVPQRALEVHQGGLLVQQQRGLFLRDADVLPEVFVKGQRVLVRITERLDCPVL